MVLGTHAHTTHTHTYFYWTVPKVPAVSSCGCYLPHREESQIQTSTSVTHINISFLPFSQVNMVLSSHNQNEDTKMFSVRVYPFCKEQDLFSFDPKARQLQKKKLKIKNLQLREGELAFTMLNKLVTQQLSKKKKKWLLSLPSDRANGNRDFSDPHMSLSAYKKVTASQLLTAGCIGVNI